MRERRFPPSDVARVLAELLDTALADHWTEGPPTMAVLWQTPADPDDLRLAVKELEGTVEEELAALDDGGTFLAAAHSVVTSEAIRALSHPGGGPVRLTVAADHDSESGVLRHCNGATEWFGDIDLPIIPLVRRLLWLAPAA
ncbi:MAG TPA: hypothetical protein VHL53_12165 [Acidimicrobiia bacterium]|nr:hypothetical protein [Acidimicrobiia bacterium]